MKKYLGLFGLFGTIISLIYIGCCYQSGAIANDIIATNNPSWNEKASYFIDPAALYIGVISLVISVVCLVIGIYFEVKSSKIDSSQKRNA